MGEDWAVYSKQSPWREAEEQSAHFERDHACAQERMSMGRLSAGIWAGQDGLQSLQPLECAGNLAEHLRGGGRTCWTAGTNGSRQHACQSASLRWRRKRGASEQAIGITKGGRNSKIHGLVDKLCRPWVLILTPGNTADCTVGPACVSLLDGIAELLGDKAYDSNSFRKSLRKDGIKPVIPGRSNRKKRIRHDKQAYKDRNVIERCYCRLKDFRRIATRYDKLARNYFSALCLVAAVAFWL
jgi:transposase